jgi:hypothetical protein
MMDTPLLQLVAYISLTVASITVATVSAIFGYRQNYGWRPLALVTGHGLHGIGGSRIYRAILTVEFWNRRKYPIAVNSASVKFATMEFKYEASPDAQGWSRTGDHYFKRLDQRLEPAAHVGLEFTAPFEAPSIDALRDTVEVEIHYFDPISGKGLTARTRHVYTFQRPEDPARFLTVEPT